MTGSSPSRRISNPWSPSRVSTLRAAAAVLAAAALLTGCDRTPPEKPDAAAAQSSAGSPPSAPPSGSCAAPAQWFPHSNTPEPNPNQAFASFCDFHQWAWQSFLWLTQSADGQKLRFETFPTVEDVIAGQDTSKSRGAMKLLVRTQKVHGPHQPLNEVTQANSLGVLVDQQGRAGYYSQYVNPAMFQQIVSLKWNDPKVLDQIPPGTTFATGNVELKISWKIVRPGENVSGFYVRPALVDKLVTGKDGKVVVDKTAPPVEVQVALVGFHVVGWVQGHPEAVWATFEHRNNAPDFAAGQSPSAPVSDHDWTFYKGGTLATNCNQVDTADLKLVDPATQVLKPVTQVCREFPYGMVAGTKNSNDLQNLQAIQTLDASVQSQLGSDVAKNYFEVGAIWTNGNLQPNNDQQANLIGSTRLNNSVIETFTQNVSGSNNCFSCHNTLMYNPSDPSIQPLQGTNINLSHIILEAYIANQGQGKENR